MAIYVSEQAYIESATTIQEQIVKIDAIINGLLDSAIKSATTGHMESYTLDSGQSKITTVYRDLESIQATVQKYQKLKDLLTQTLNNNCFGRVTRLVDSTNFYK